MNKMVQRAIIIFPELKNIELIDQLRKKYDPLADCIRPHITLVFPFYSDISEEQLRDHMEEALRGRSAFEIELRGITATPDGYLFLNVKKGNDALIELHDRLYSGILRDFYYRGCSYTPHITVGRLTDPGELKNALEYTENFDHIFETIATRVSVEIIGEDESSTVELEIPLAEGD